MGALKLTYSEELPALKVVQGLFSNEEKSCARGYRYGFNGQEKDNEIAGSGNSYTAEFWQYDSRLGRRWNVDVKHKLLPHNSPYSIVGNIPTIANDVDGDICIPCIVLLLGGISFPSLAIAPTLDFRKDELEINRAKEIQAKWVVYTLFATGIGAGTVSLETFATQAAEQVSVQVIIQSLSQLDSDGKINLENVLIESVKNIDAFDIVFGKVSGVGILDNILTAAVDITPSEAQLLGLDKDAKSSTVDFIINTVVGSVGRAKGKFSAILKKAQDKASAVAGEELKDLIQKEHGIQAKQIQSESAPPDATSIAPIIVLPLKAKASPKFFNLNRAPTSTSKKEKVSKKSSSSNKHQARFN